MRAHAALGVLGLLIAGYARGEGLFSEQTSAQGVQFTHHPIQNDDLIIGAGGAWGDFDGDGDIDLYVADQVGANRLFKNLGAGAGFVNVAADYGVDDPDGEGHGALWGDYDNDGDKDLYVMNRGDSIMFHNDGPDGSGGWLFTDVTEAIGAGAFGRPSAAAYGDYDNDGWLDLYVAIHSYSLHHPQEGEADRCDYLFHNVEGPDGQRMFVDIAPEVFTADTLERSVAHSVGFLDFDNDGDLDIYLVNEQLSTDPSLLCALFFRNDGENFSGGWKFTEITELSGAALCANPMGLAIGDYNNDGWLDMATSDIGPNHLFKNNNGLYSDVAGQADVDRILTPEGEFQFGWGIAFLDYNLDAYEDLFVATGVRNDKLQQKPLFINNGNPPDNTFTDVTDQTGCGDPNANTHGLLKADYDGDGDEDLYLVSYDGEAVLCRNDQVGGDYAVFELVGMISNHDAVGARVKLSAAGLPDQYRFVQSGSTTNGGHDLAHYFGVTGATMVDQVVIDWPSGLQTTLTNLPINQRYKIFEIREPIKLPVSGPTLLAADASASYSATLQFNYGDSEDVTESAVWSVVEGSAFAEFTSPGTLKTFAVGPSGSASIKIRVEYDSLETELSATIQDVVVDVDPPVVVITAPTTQSAMTTSEPMVELRGSAAENVALASVVWANDRGGSGPCGGLTEWFTGAIALMEGDNLVTITARDTTGNAASKSITINRVIPAPVEPPPDDNPPPLEEPPSGNDNTVDNTSEPPPVDPSANDNADIEPSPTDDNSSEPPADNSTGQDLPEEPPSSNKSGNGNSAATCGAFGLLHWPIVFLGLCTLRRRSAVS